MKVHYLEIVSLDVDLVCESYELAHGVNFSPSDPLLGGAKTCVLADGCIIGVRAPLRENEAPVIRPYWLVENIEQAVLEVQSKGAEIAVAPLDIPSKGLFAIYILGGVEQGLWQL
ncbi:hydroxylase [Pseudoalteromonas sp. SMS1]|uniref:VOC family protein n=1 Tax=Pseudoalteromonas sp. SMS1 TaxID=2908894 RepID=UPI001F1999FB|nr:hydroxylase [Pseudoalteromonas sp. SMS1]MCF2859149.1 hydroxylase [Pseudoalteromonas sp. SMS1]